MEKLITIGLVFVHFLKALTPNNFRKAVSHKKKVPTISCPRGEKNIWIPQESNPRPLCDQQARNCLSAYFNDDDIVTRRCHSVIAHDKEDAVFRHRLLHAADHGVHLRQLPAHLIVAGTIFVACK